MRKEKYLNIRVSDMDFDKIQQASESENISISEYARMVLLDASEATLMEEEKHDSDNQILEEILDRVAYVQGYIKLDILGELPEDEKEKQEMLEEFVEAVREKVGLEES